MSSSLLSHGADMVTKSRAYAGGKKRAGVCSMEVSRSVPFDGEAAPPTFVGEYDAKTVQVGFTATVRRLLTRFDTRL